jgi:hypothetical protein
MSKGLLMCKNCDAYIITDPIDDEEYIHYWTGDNVCRDGLGNGLDSYAEPKEPNG